MDQKLLVTYGFPALGGLLSLLFLFLAVRAGRRQRLVADLPTSKTTGVFIGLVDHVLQHPSSDHPRLFYRRPGRHETRGADDGRRLRARPGGSEARELAPRHASPFKRRRTHSVESNPSKMSQSTGVSHIGERLTIVRMDAS